MIFEYSIWISIANAAESNVPAEYIDNCLHDSYDITSNLAVRYDLTHTISSHKNLIWHIAILYTSNNIGINIRFSRYNLHPRSGHKSL